MKIKLNKLLVLCLCVGTSPFGGLGALAQSITGSYAMHINNAAAKKTVDINITFKNEKSCLEIITEEGAGKFRTIFDNKEKTMTILTEKEGASKFAMIRHLPEDVESSTSESKDTKITLTDEKKTIENYSCKKVIVETSDAITEMWMTEDLRVTYADMVTILNRGGGPVSSMIQNIKNNKELKGFAIKMIITGKIKPGEVTSITIDNIKTNAVDNSVFNTAGYQVMDMRNAGNR